MNRKWLLPFALLALVALLAACGGGEPEVVTETIEVPVEVEVTREVEVEVTREVETVVTETVTETSTEQVAVEFAGGGDTLSEIQDRGFVKCGLNATLAGFGTLDPDTNEFSGFDVDFCKAVAAAILGDAEAIEGTATTGTSRFPTLQSGEVDILVRNTTWTISRDTSLGFDFNPVTFYDGQGMMVGTDSGIETLEDMAGATICVQAGTTTEKNLADVFRAIDVEFTPAVFPDNPSTTEAYAAGQCDGITTDKSGLASIRINNLDVPEDHVILDVTMSKEPLGPLTRHGDNNFNDIVSWVVNCTFQAEESGVTQANVDEQLGSEDPAIQNLLGVTGDLGQALGLPNDFCYQVISQLGNYGEIYDRHLGPDTPLNLPRGLNEQYYNGGLIYAPPFR
ncbi:MAG: amino acid ABC transporter substrate-binding protein [Ardenticatenaceae bacterium]|nr:amino acid ABC transporter substrate-binding protein [Ardenticatenaceae bacterium]